MWYQITGNQMGSPHDLIRYHSEPSMFLWTTNETISLRLHPRKQLFNRIPLAPPGTKTVVHKSPYQRKSWGSYGFQSWYIIPTTKHYSCNKFYIASTAGIRDVLNFDWFLGKIHFPRSWPKTTYVNLHITCLPYYLKQISKNNFSQLWVRHHKRIQQNRYILTVCHTTPNSTPANCYSKPRQRN